MRYQEQVIVASRSGRISKEIITDYVKMKDLHRMMNIYKLLSFVSGLGLGAPFVNIENIFSADSLIGLGISAGVMAGSIAAMVTAKNKYTKLRQNVVDNCMSICASDDEELLSETMSVWQDMCDRYQVEEDDIFTLGEDACDELINSTNGY